MHIKTNFTEEFFSFGLRDVVNLSTTFFIQRCFCVFYFFHKKRVFLTIFILGVNVFFTSMILSVARDTLLSIFPSLVLHIHKQLISAAVNGFRKTGINPIDLPVFRKVNFIVAQMTDRDFEPTFASPRTSLDEPACAR